MDAINEHILLNIKSLRGECGWSQSELSRRSSVTASAISMIESGKRVPSIAVLIKISKAMKVSISELIGESTQDDTNKIAKEFLREFSDVNELNKDHQKIILDLAKSLKE